ncbi:MAG: 50S ribosomal protein L18e [Methanocellales archaeon]
MKRIRKTNSRIIKLINDLKAKSREQNVKIWRDIAERLEGPRRNYAEVNLSRINRYTKENEVIVVPGKVLGSGTLDHAVTVAALDFSSSAAKQILSLNGKCLTIEELLNLNPKGRGVRIFQ